MAVLSSWPARSWEIGSRGLRPIYKGRNRERRPRGLVVSDYPHPKLAVRPRSKSLIVYSLFIRYDSGVAFQREETDGKPMRAGLAVFLAAAFIAAVRLARVENLSPSPKLVSTLSDSLVLARRLLDDTRKKFPELF